MRRSLHVILLIALLLQQFSFLSFNTPAEVAQAASLPQDGITEPVEPPTDEELGLIEAEPINQPQGYDGTEPVVITEITTQELEVTESAVEIVEEPQPGIILTSDSQVILDRQQVRLSWEANQIKVPDTANWVLQLPLSLYPVDFGFSTIDEEAGIGTVNLRTRRQINDLVVQADEFDAGPFIVVLQLWDGEEQLAETSLTLETPGLDRIQPEGGTVRHPYLPVEVRFGANENRPALNLRVHDLPADNPAKLEPGLLEPAFEVLAYNKAAESLVTSFEEQIEIEVYIGTGYEVAGLVYYDEIELAWLPIPSEYDPETGIVTGYTTHFTAFSIDAAKSISANIPNMSSTQVGPFTGAGTTSYPLWTPPGIAGLQPSLALSYNSQSVDNFVPTAQQVSWVGGGWNLSTGYIELDTHGTLDFNSDDTYNLVVNGVSMRILKTSTNLYRAEEESYWKIVFDQPSNTWTVYDKTGKVYVFGESVESRARYFYIRNSSQCADPEEWFTWRWGLTTERPAYGTGNTINYTYTKHTMMQRDLYCNPQFEYQTDVATYPNTITYAGGLYQVKFNLEARSDYQSAWADRYKHIRFHSQQRLQSVEVLTDSDGAAPYVMNLVIRKYNLGYTNLFPGWTYSQGGKAFSLASIQETVLNGATNPATTYTYGDAMHLTQVNNGYGGSVSFTYQIWYDQDTRRTDNLIYSDRNQACPRDWRRYYNWGIINAGCNNDRVIVDGQNFPIGDPLEKYNGRVFTMFGETSYQPGGAYYITVTAGVDSGSSALYVDLDYPQGAVTLANGLPVAPWNSVELKTVWIAPSNPIQPTIYDRLQLRIGRAPYSSLYLSAQTDVYLLTTRYRVISKTVTDAWSGESYTSDYTYDEAATNDRVHSAVSAANSDPFRMYTPIGAEYRGNAFYQEILPPVNGGTSRHTRMTWFYQDDNLKSQPSLSLTGWQRYSEQFEAGTTPAGWTVTGNGLVEFRTVNNDKAWHFESGGNTVGTTRSQLLGNENALMVHFRTNGSGTMNLLAIGTDQSKIGIRVTGTTVNQVLKVGLGNETTTQIMTGFKNNTWYYMLLFLDNDHLMVRVQERDNPSAVSMSEVETADVPDDVQWTFLADANTGWLELDSYWEGAVYEMRSYVHAVDFQVGWTKYAGLNWYDDLIPRRVYQTLATHMLTEKTGAWRGTAEFYYYDKELQGNNDTQWGNRTMTVSAYYKAGTGWVAQDASVTRFTPNPNAANYLVALPFAHESYDCTYQGVIRSHTTCHNDIIGGSLASALIGLSYTIYDDTSFTNPIPGAAPTVGKPTAQRSSTSLNSYADTFFTYNSVGNLTEQKMYTGTGIWQTYASTGTEQKTTFGYDATNVYQTSVTKHLSGSVTHATTLTYDKRLGLPLTQTDPNNAVSSITYDDLGRLTRLYLPLNTDAVVKVNYAVQSNHTIVTTETLYKTTPSATYLTQSRVYDGLGRVVQERQHGAVLFDTSNTFILKDTWYDGWGTAYKVSVPYHAASLPGTPVRSTTAKFSLTKNDGMGRTVSQEAPDGTFVTTTYSLAPRIVESVARWDLGVVATTTDARNNVTTTQQDVFGRTIEVKPATGPSVKYKYDVLGRMIETDYGGAISTLTYDWAGRKTAMNDADMGAWSYSYDALGNLTKQTDARGVITCLNYDAFNRLELKNYNQNSACSLPPTSTVSYTYDGGTNQKGLRTGMTDASGSTVWTYDLRGRMLTETKAVTGYGSFKTSYTYNPDNSLASMSYPSGNSGATGETVNYSYNSQAMLTTVSGSATYASGMTYDVAGRMRQVVRGTLTTAYTYNVWEVQGGRLSQIQTSPSALQSLTYTYDNNGNVLSINDNSITTNYTYDTLDRLITVSGGQSGSYTYNSTTGNLATSNGQSYSYNDTSSKHAATNMGSNTFAYDANGNMTWRTVGGTTHQFVYDGANQLTQVKNSGGTVIASFTYDGDGRRVIATEAGTTTVFIGNYFEWKNSAMTKYYYAGGMRLAVRNGNTSGTSQLSYLLTDHLGSTRLTYRADTAAQTSVNYTSWGVASGNFGTTTAYTYTGQYSHTASFGLMYYNARWYDPTLNRFAQADTIIPVNQGTQAYDRYAYVNNNPIRFNDPSGHCLLGCIGDAIVLGALAGGFISAGVSAIIEFQTTGNVTLEQTVSAFVGGAVAGGIMAAAAPASLAATVLIGGAANVAGSQASAATSAIMNPSKNGFWEDYATAGGVYNGSSLTNLDEAVTDFVIGGAFSAVASGVNNKLFPTPRSGPYYQTIEYNVDYINNTSGWVARGGGYPLNASSSRWGMIGGIVHSGGRTTVDTIAEYGNQVTDQLKDLVQPE